MQSVLDTILQQMTSPTMAKNELFSSACVGRQPMDSFVVWLRLRQELVELVKKHYNPRPSAITQRFKFNSRVRQPGETVAEYIAEAELRKLSEHCDFKDTLEDMLRDRLVWGIADSRIQHRLLSEDKLTFTAALELTQAMELAAKDIKETHGAATPQCTPVLKVQGQGGAARGSKNSSCYRCGGKHLASRCRFKTE